jgi:MFS family permease
MDTKPPAKSSQQTADEVAATYFGVTDPASRRKAIRECLIGSVEALVLIPLLFYARFGTVGPLGWGTTVFMSAYLLVEALALYFRPRTEYHTKVKLRGDWIDRMGAFWLVGCAFGPFFGWILTSALIPITPASWRWLFGLRILLAAVIPVLLALPMTRYLRGKAALVALPLLLLITLLPVSSAMNVSLDLWEGPTVAQSPDSGKLFLKHMQYELGPSPGNQGRGSS